MKSIRSHRRIIAIAICIMVCLACCFIMEETNAMADNITSNSVTKTGEKEKIESVPFLHVNDMLTGSMRTASVPAVRLSTRSVTKYQMIRNTILFIFAILFKIALIPCAIFMFQIVRMTDHHSDRARMIRGVHRKDGKK